MRALLLAMAILGGCGGTEPIEAPLDADNDGIEDALDGCPDEPETLNAYEDADGCPDVAPLSITRGTWTGDATVTMSGTIFHYAETLVVSDTTHPERVTVAGTCPVSGPAVTATATHDTATWTGVITCPPVSMPWCDVLHMHHESVSVSVGADGLARIHINGHADGCGRTGVPYSITALASH